VTSGTLAPTVNQPIAMAYLPLNHAQPQHEVYAEVRGKRLPMRVTPMPFTPPLQALKLTTAELNPPQSPPRRSPP
jgi:glycine cleavage system aminomethyltransferase T